MYIKTDPYQFGELYLCFLKVDVSKYVAGRKSLTLIRTSNRLFVDYDNRLSWSSSWVSNPPRTAVGVGFPPNQAGAKPESRSFR